MINTILIKLLPFSYFKIIFLRLLGAKIGEGVKIGYLSTIHTKNYSNVEIGNYVEIGRNVELKVSKLKINNLSIIGKNVLIEGNGSIDIGKACYIPTMYIDGSGKIEVGDYSALPPHGLIYSHNYSDSWFNQGSKYQLHNVKIGNKVWIGAGSSILNANIGDESLIAGGSIVLQDIPNNSFAIGNPARVLKENKFNKVKEELFINKYFQKDIQNNSQKVKILFTKELNEENNNYEIIICDKCNIDATKAKNSILEINKNHIYNMKKSILPTIKKLRSWGIFLSY